MVLTVLGIDPGPEQSAWVQLREGFPISFGKEGNHAVKHVCQYAQTYSQNVAIEMIASYGMAVGAEVFETCVWIGRFMETLIQCNIPEKDIFQVKRLEVKSHLCHSGKASDTNIRQALVDRFGGAERAISGRKCAGCKGRGKVGLGKSRAACAACNGSGWEIPRGPLFHIKDDVWAALAVAVTHWDRVKPEGYKK